MDDRSTVFLEVMIGIAIVGLLAFLILLVARRVGGSSERGSEQVLGAPPWWAFLLAVGLLIIVALVVLWQFPPLTDEVGAGGWREDTGALVFFVVMLVAAGLGLITYLVFLYAGTRRPLSRDRASSDETTSATASGVGLLGVLALGVAFLILNWAYVASDLQYALMRNLLYPASFAVGPGPIVRQGDARMEREGRDRYGPRVAALRLDRIPAGARLSQPRGVQ